ncbi:peptidoglycan-binding protein [Pectobacterium phage POP12]|nr:peptidoglycan-binding protein [Pectobacterium phage POP12]
MVKLKYMGNVVTGKTVDEAKAKMFDLTAKYNYEVIFGTYQVKEGDTLRDIAFQYYKDTNMWTTIYKNNRIVIGDDPNIIKPGMILKIF